MSLQIFLIFSWSFCWEPKSFDFILGYDSIHFTLAEIKLFTIIFQQTRHFSSKNLLEYEVLCKLKNELQSLWVNKSVVARPLSYICWHLYYYVSRCKSPCARTNIVVFVKNTQGTWGVLWRWTIVTLSMLTLPANELELGLLWLVTRWWCLTDCWNLHEKSFNLL